MVLKTLLSAFAKLRPARIVPFIYDNPGLHLDPSIKVRNHFTTSLLYKIERKNEIADGFNQSKAKIILTLNFKSADDCLPFYKLPIKKLLEIQKVTKDDEKQKYCENRLYFISSKIKCPPAIVSVQLARRTFVFDLSFDWLERSLNILLEKGVTGDRILRDLWVLKYNHKTIGERLQRIQDMGLHTLYPWMVRCSPEILSKYITQTQETKNILGESRSTQMYLADRLNISIEDVEDLCMKMPALKTMRVTKIKKFLDFLIDEGFSVEDIANKPRVLGSSQKTIKYRLHKLRKIGLKNINLNFLCRSRKDFQKCYESLEGNYDILEEIEK